MMTDTSIKAVIINPSRGVNLEIIMESKMAKKIEIH